VLQAFGDGTLFGETYGEGPVRIVWLHGWGRRGQDFSAAASALASDGVASVALDLPGFGASAPPRDAGGARHYVDLITPTMCDLAERPVVLVGHSFGGSVATVLAARHPDLVRALVLTGPPLVRPTSSGRRSLRFRALRWGFARGLVPEVRMERARQRYGSRDYRAATGVMRAVLVASVNERYDDELARISAPVTFLWGELDTEVPPSIALEAQSMLHVPSTMRVLAGVGHLVPTEAPGDLAAAVREVLE